MKIITLSILLSAISVAKASLNVLALLPFDSYSHFSVGFGIARALIDAGHHVTVVSPFPLEKPLKNYTEISTEDFIDFMDKKNENLNAFSFESGLKIAPLLEMLAFNWVGSEMVDFYMQHPKIQKLLKSNENYDVCLVESLFFDSLNYGIAEHFGCTMVTFLDFAATKIVDDLTGNLSPPSYVPKVYHSFTDNMTYCQRFRNVIYTYLEDFVHEFFVKSIQRRQYRKYFPMAKKSFDEMHKRASIIFMNNHIAVSTPRALMPNVIEIGAIHIQKNKELPEDIKDFIDSAKDGVILFSMGAPIKSSQWPVEKREVLLKTFGRLKQKIIWNNDSPSLPNKPDNVMIKSKLSQYQHAILSHQNAKLFISHGGLVGVTEGFATATPLLILPIFSHDQKLNKAWIVEAGNGLHLDYSNITQKSLTNAINELLTNKKYRENAKIIADRFNDRPLTPQESVVYWTEYAVKHQGHLQSQAAINLGYFASRSWDVYLLIDGILIIFLILDFLILRAILRKIVKKFTTDKVKKN